MTNPLPLTNAEGEVRELTEADYKNAVPFSRLPESLQTTLSGIQGRVTLSLTRRLRLFCV